MHRVRVRDVGMTYQVAPRVDDYINRPPDTTLGGT